MRTMHHVCVAHAQEIMVDDNPLVLPSVTAFQMGGPNQMFRPRVRILVGTLFGMEYLMVCRNEIT